MTGTWREEARRVITRTLKESGLPNPIPQDQIKVIRKIFRRVYPFGERKYYPYKVWCEEVKKVMLPIKESRKINIIKDRCAPWIQEYLEKKGYIVNEQN